MRIQTGRVAYFPVAKGRLARWIGGSFLVSGTVAALILAIVLSSGSSPGVVRGGPLAEHGVRMGESAVMDVGQAGTYGAETLTNHGHVPLVLDRISVVGRSKGLEVIRPLVMRVRTEPGLPALVAGLVRQFPPPHEGATLHSVSGFRVAPHRSWKDDVELLIGFRAHRRGVLSYRALELRYHVGNTRYVTMRSDPLVICVPRSFPLSRCRAH
jgi:hypothetical protein